MLELITDHILSPAMKSIRWFTLHFLSRNFHIPLFHIAIIRVFEQRVKFKILVLCCISMGRAHFPSFHTGKTLSDHPCIPVSVDTSVASFDIDHQLF